MVDTPWEAKNVAPPVVSDPNNDVLRASIVAEKTMSLGVLLMLRDIIMEVQMSIDPFYLTRVPFLTRLDEVTWGEVLVRVTLGIAKWVDLYCVLLAFSSAGTIWLAFVDPDKVRKLRPIFGSVSDAYTIRGFWG